MKIGTSLNNVFQHTYFKAYNWLWRRSEIDIYAKAVYGRLMQCGYKTGKFWASQQFIAKELCISKITVIRSLKKLQEVGLIRIQRNGKKMFNNYEILFHGWMDKEFIEESITENESTNNEQNAESEVTNRHITAEGEVSNRYQVKYPIDTSILIDKSEKISSNTLAKPATPSSDLFERFYQEYPLKRDKKAAMKAFSKLNVQEELLIKMLSSVKKYTAEVEGIRKKGGKLSYKYPATWLNGQCWENDYTESGETKTPRIEVPFI